MTGFPQIRLMGITGVLIRFADRLSEPANRAALAFRAAAEAEAWPGVAETTTALASAFLRVDPLVADVRDVAERARALAHGRDWTALPLPPGRRLWRIPCAWGGSAAPDLGDAAARAGLSEAEAVAALSSARTRVLTLGFAPGQPYLGELEPAWDLPRRTELQTVPQGAVLLAVRQFVLFTAAGPTGWRHVGQTAFWTFRPDADAGSADADTDADTDADAGAAAGAAEAGVPLRPGDEITFPAAPLEQIAEMQARRVQDGGATAETLP